MRLRKHCYNCYIMNILKRIFGFAKDKGYNVEAVRSFMDRNDKLAFGKGCIYFYDSGEMLQAQKGFSEDENGKSLITNSIGSWDKTWLVIGKENICDDPIFVDTYSEQLPVFTAIREHNNWEPVEIAPSLSSLQKIIAEIRKINGDDQECGNHSETAPEKQRHMEIISRENAGLDNWWWEAML